MAFKRNACWTKSCRRYLRSSLSYSSAASCSPRCLAIASLIHCFSRDIRYASSLFTREFNSKGTRSPDQIADAYERTNDATYRLTADFRDDVLAAIGLGKISPKKAEEILKANRIGKEDIAMIRSGRYKKYEPSDAAKKIAPKDRIKAADAAVKRAKDTPL